MKHKPPKIAQWLLKRFLDRENSDHRVGDFEEYFQNICSKYGKFSAYRWYWFQTFKSVPEFINFSIFRSFDMFKNYIITAFRNIKRHKVYSVINIFGLSLGLACSILVYMFINHELSFDSFHENADYIYTFTAQENSYQNANVWNSGTPAPIGDALKEYYSEIIDAVSFYPYNQGIVRYGENVFRENIAFASPHFFQFFSFRLAEGSPETVLKSDNSLVITKSAAVKYFGNDYPVGKTLRIRFKNKEKEFVVSGISEEVPGNSSISYNFIAHIKNLDFLNGPGFLSSWGDLEVSTYFQLEKGASIETVKFRFPSFKKQYLAYLKGLRNWDKPGDPITFYILNIKDAYLGHASAGGPHGDMDSSYIFSTLVIIVLIISSINYMNLSIGRASGRAVEICIRKVIGAHRKRLILQFWTETLMITFIALAAGLLLALLVLPVFNELTNKQITFGSFLTVKNFLFLLILTFIVGSVSGGFPSLVMSSFQPVNILKGKLKLGGRNLFTKFLVIVQFVFSIILIISMQIMSDQMNYMSDKDLGFDKEGQVLVDIQADDYRSSESVFNLYKESIGRYNFVKNVSGSVNTFISGSTYYSAEEGGEKYRGFYNQVDHDYIKTLGISLVEGRDFSRSFSTDTTAALVNREFVSSLKLDDPISAVINSDDLPPFRIIGVMKDYYSMPLDIRLYPQVLIISKRSKLNKIIVKIDPENRESSITVLKKAWKDVQPDKPFIYSMLDMDLKERYENHRKAIDIFIYAAILAIVIAGMGIFGLTAISISRRIKEIGIRKVMGADTYKIVMLLSKNFLYLVIIANIIAWPLSYFLMYRWLQMFAFNPGLNIFSFLLAGIITILITLVTVFVQTFRASAVNPVDSLRRE
ncbi:ABC transporter permease [candidate division KSB1 bacterium]